MSDRWPICVNVPMDTSFKLSFVDKCPFELGQEVYSPIADDFGNVTRFSGRGWVSRVEWKDMDSFMLFTVEVTYSYYGRRMVGYSALRGAAL